MLKPVLFAIVCVCILSIAIAHSADTKTAISPDITNAWKKQKERQVNFQSTHVYSVIEKEGKRKINTTIAKRLNQSALQMSTSEGEHKSKAIVTNSKYSFAATRSKPDGGWALTQLILEPNAKLRGSPQTVFEECNQLLFAHMMISDQTIWDTLETTMEAVKIEKVANSPNLLKIFLKIDPNKTASRKKNPITSGWVIIDSNYDWSITEQSLDGAYPNQPPMNFATRRELAKASSGVAYAKTSTNVIGGSDPMSADRSTTVFDNTLDVDVTLDECDFSLTAFGLPEPEGHVVKQPYPKYVWWILAGAIFLVIGIIARLKMRRSS